MKPDWNPVTDFSQEGFPGIHLSEDHLVEILHLTPNGFCWLNLEESFFRDINGEPH